MNNEWSDFEKYVFSELTEIRKEVSAVNNKVSGLKGKVAIISAFIGAVIAVLKDKLHL